LVAAARDLVHRQGIARTTLAEIADAADVPVGNVYYYFKTKDEIVSAVVGAHSDQLRAAFAELEHDHTDPADRLVAFVDLQAGWVSSAPPQYGCPYGTISTELAKQTAPDPLTATLLELQLDWLEEQFRTMGRPDPRDLAVQLLVAWQGSAVLTSALGQPELMATQAQRLREWITDLG
jgi:AcrR family transcriptional regulator